MKLCCIANDRVIIEYIEKSTGKKMIISSDGINGKYNGIFDSNLDISRVESLGFKFNNIKIYIIVIFIIL